MEKHEVRFWIDKLFATLLGYFYGMKKSEIISLKNVISKIDLIAKNAYKLLFNLFTKDYGMPIITVPIKENSLCFRSRNNIGDNDFLNFCELSYPPKNCIKKYSRANIPNQQIFYCSDNYEANIAELMPYWLNEVKIGETFAVTTSEWKTKSPLLVAIIPDFKNERLMNLLKTLTKLNEGTIEREYWDFINLFFRLQGFLKPDIYKFTNAFCNALIYNLNSNGNDAQGILYTCIQHLKAWNLAILPNFVDENMELKDVFKFYITKRKIINGRPKYDNFKFPEQIRAKYLDMKSHRIYWK